MKKKKRHKRFPNSHRIKGSKCPNCGAFLDGAEHTNGYGKPKEGDFSICAYCYQFLRYNLDLSLRKATKKEVIDEGVKDDLFTAKKKLVAFNKMLEREE